MPDKVMKLVSLNRRRALQKRMERQQAKAWLVNAARNAPEDIDGFGLVMFRRNQNGTFTSRTHFYVRDATDGPRLPELARQELDRHVRDSDDG